MKNKTSISVSVLSILIMVALSATVVAQPVPPGFFISGSVTNCCTNESANEGIVKIENLNTSDVFSTTLGQIFWWANYRLIMEDVGGGNVLQISASDNNGNCTEYNYTVTDDDVFYSGFLQNPIIGPCGDVDCDGKIRTGDADMISDVAAGVIPASYLKNEWAADVDGSGKIRTGDADIVDYVAGGLLPASYMNCRTVC